MPDSSLPPKEVIYSKVNPHSSYKRYIAFGIGGSFLLLYLLIVVLVIVASMEKNKDIYKMKNELTTLTNKYAWLEEQLNTEKGAKETIEKALNTVQRTPSIIDYATVSEVPQVKIGELLTPFNDQTVSKVAIKTNYALGNFVNVSIFAIADTQDLSKTVKIGETQVSATLLGTEQEFVLTFARPIELYADNNYLIVISTSTDSLTKAGIGYTKDDTYTDGTMYKYAPDTGWVEYPEQDLYFRFE